MKAFRVTPSSDYARFQSEADLYLLSTFPFLAYRRPLRTCLALAFLPQEQQTTYTT